ncbi:hypothetical protein M2373_002760 [Chryseobacterium sp. JUb7]|nr:hypothetical protein [Chryseobacterium sp. JUb7]
MNCAVFNVNLLLLVNLFMPIGTPFVSLIATFKNQLL